MKKLLCAVLFAFSFNALAAEPAAKADDKAAPAKEEKKDAKKAEKKDDKKDAAKKDAAPAAK